MANPNIGHVKCPIMNQLAVVRNDCRGKLYYYSQAGKIAPNLAQGQTWLRDNTTMWENPNVPPDHITLTVETVGAPPTIHVNESMRIKTDEKPTKNPLTHQDDETRINLPKKQSALSYLFGGDK